MPSSSPVRWLVGFALCCGLLVGALPTGAAAQGDYASSNRQVYALSVANELLRFEADRPEAIEARVPIINLKPGESVLGIDFRPATGRLYGLGSTSQLYVIDTKTGFARPIGAPFTPSLNGTAFGVDFNPVVDLFRIVSDADQNLRVNPDTGQVVGNDGALAYAAGDRSAGQNPNVVGAAYSNPDNDPATATTLYDIDSLLDSLAIQNPPNTGTLNSVGALGVDSTELAGFDIGLAGNGRNYGGGGDTNVALAALQIGGGSSQLYSIDLASGRAQRLGKIGDQEQVRGLAIELNAAQYEDVYAVNTNNQLLGFAQNRPGRIRSRVDISGLKPGESVLGIDFRPATGRLYGLGSTSQLYVVNHITGVATAIGTPFTPSLNGTAFGVDFNPVVDLLRIVSDADQNLRVNPNTGQVAGNDGALAYAAGDRSAGQNPNVVGAAYSNPDNDPATATTLYDIDSLLDSLAIQNPPNTGTLNSVGALGVNSTDLAGFDIGLADSDSSYQALAALQVGGGSSQLYSIDLASGRAKNRGRIGSREQIRGLAIALESAERTYR